MASEKDDRRGKAVGFGVPGLNRRAFRRASDGPQLGGITPVFTGMGLVEGARTGQFGRHQHTNYEVIYVDEGIYRCTHNDLDVTLRRNGVVILKPGDWHQDIFDGSYIRFFGMTFRLEGPEGRAPDLFREETPTARQHFSVTRRDFFPIIRSLMKESGRADYMSAHIQDALVLQFFYLMVRAIPRRVLSDYFVERSVEAAFAARLHSLLNRRISRPLTVGRMAEIMGMSESSLAHKSKALLGCPPAKLFSQIKMNRAMRMLKNTTMSVKEISAYLGFSSQFHFSAAFKKTFGMPPSEMMNDE